MPPPSLRSRVEELEGTARVLTRELEAQSAQAAQFRTLFEFAPDAYYLSDLKGVFIDGNRAAEQLSGYERDELIGASFLELDLLPLPQIPRAAKLLALNALGKPTGPDAFTLCRKDGQRVEIEVRTLPVEIGGKTRVLGIARDVTERRKILNALRKSEERYQRAAMAGRVGVWEWDLVSNEMYLAPELKSLIGYDEHEIRDHMDDWSRHVHPDDTEKVGAAVEPCLNGDATSFDVEHRMLHKDGSVRWFLGRGTVIRNDDGQPVRMVGSDVDVTEHKRTEEQRSRLEAETRLLQAQRLESLGVLAGGVAHDFNNMLTTILGNASLVLAKLEPASPLRELVDRIEEGALRASEIATQLLAYSGKGRFFVEPVGLNRLTQEMIQLLGTSISKKARLRVDLDETEPFIEADASQIRQVIMNLVLNASDAVDAVGGGAITVLTRTVVDDASPVRRAILEVADDGPGMDEETLTRIFEPFFTTKSSGRGLGLAAVQGIVRGHEGTIEIDSEPSAGTTVRVTFPATQRRLRAAVADARSTEPELRTSPTVLVVDDEAPVRSVAARILEDEGFTVRTASSGSAAVAEFDTMCREISIVLLDLTMPDIDGDVVIRRLRSIQPDVRVVLMSGYDEGRSKHRLHGAVANGFVKKPFRSQDLVGELKRCLSATEARAASNDT